MTQRVFVDANVLFSKTLYDWLFMLRIESNGDLFHIYTSWDVITEAGARIRDKNPEWSGAGVSSLIDKIRKHFDEIVTEFEGGPVDSVTDEGDWHVHHAAEACRADILLTQDTGFESDNTHYETYTCDDFFVEVGKSAPNVLRKVTRDQMGYWARMGGKQLPDALRDAGCPKFAKQVLEQLQLLART